MSARSWSKLAIAATLALSVAGAGAAVATTGVVGPSTGLMPNGRQLVPDGRLTTVGDFPTGGALTPDGRFYWAVDSGYGHDDVQVVSVATGAVTQVLPLPGAYGGIAFDASGTHAYVSGEPSGAVGASGPTVGGGGDVIHVFAVEPASGHAAEGAPVVLPPTTGGTAQSESCNPASDYVGVPGQGALCAGGASAPGLPKTPGPGPTSGLGWPIGLAVTPDGSTLVAALNQADQVALVHLATGTTTLVKVGRYPFGAATDGTDAYVSNEYDGTVSVVHLATAKVTATVRGLGGALGDLNSHPEGMVLDAAHHRLYVAVANRDTVDVVDTTLGAVRSTVGVGRTAGVGVAPVALALSPDGRRLYAADSGEDAVAVLDVGAGFGAGSLHLAGRLPTAAYPTGVALTPDDGQLVWLSAEGLGAGPNPLYGTHFAASQRAPYGQYDVEMLAGRVGVLPVPSDATAAAEEAAVDTEVAPADTSQPPAGTPVVGVAGGPSSKITHVFYVVKENRTYDQVFGTDRRGNGDPSLELFDDNGVPGPAGGTTPNAHALSERFPLLDNFYEDSQVSVDGHIITSGAYATDFDERALHSNYSGRGRSVNFGGDPVTLPPNDFVFDQAVRQGISFQNLGETNAGVAPAANDGRPTYAASLGGFRPYPLFFGCEAPRTTALPITADPACSTDSGTVGPGGTPGSSGSRFDAFQTYFDAEVAAGSVPALTYLTMPNDHTDGNGTGYPTPKALVADNDLGLGQLVQLISHSPIWSSSAIFVVEDDSQDGADHVDAHRSEAFVISPWANEGAVVHTRYDQESALRTIELVLGLHPLSLLDGLAEPMYDAFSSGAPDLRPYTAITPTQSLDAVTTTAATGIDAQLPFTVPDLVPQHLFDAALYRSERGAGATPPAAGPHASPDEVARDEAGELAYAQHLDVAAALRHAGGD